jgi:hypothetical protein
MKGNTAAFIPCPTARSTNPSAAVDFPFPSPVYTSVNLLVASGMVLPPLRRDRDQVRSNTSFSISPLAIILAN